MLSNVDGQKYITSQIKAKDNNQLVSDLQLHDVIIGRGKGVKNHYGN